MKTQSLSNLGLLQEWLYQWTRATNVIHSDFCKAFDMVASDLVGQIQVRWTDCQMDELQALAQCPNGSVPSGNQ